MNLNAEQVLAIAPDSGVASSGKSLAKAKNWVNLGQNDEAIWGECQGSALYQVRVSVSDLTAKCSCPSRKFPCKHSIGLLLLAANDPATVPAGTPPEWVTDWLQRRATTTEKRAAKAPTDQDVGNRKKSEATAKRRVKRVQSGLEAFDLWLDDLIRGGLAQASTQPLSFWETQAARLTDAQAPGLARRVRQLADIPNATPDWPKQLLTELGKAALLTHAFQQSDPEKDPLHADLRMALGWTLTQDEVIAQGEVVADQWQVIGRKYQSEDRLRSEWTWLYGSNSARYALLLQFAHGTAAFAPGPVPGRQIEAELAFWPGSVPQRAMMKSQTANVQPFTAFAGGDDTILALLERNATLLAQMPWLEQVPTVLRRSTLIPNENTAWLLRDETGATLPVAGTHWSLLAMTGGEPCDIVAEWHGTQLLLLGALVTDTYLQLTSLQQTRSY